MAEPIGRIVEQLAIAAGMEITNWFDEVSGLRWSEWRGDRWQPASSHDDAIALQDALVERYGEEYSRRLGDILCYWGDHNCTHYSESGWAVALASISTEARLRALHAAFPKCQECGGVGRVIGTFGEELIECPACKGSGVAIPGGGK